MDRFSRRRPAGPTELIDRGKLYDYEPSVRLSTWLRTANVIIQEAAIYYADGDYETCFMLLARYADLVADKLPSHPQAKQPDYNHALKSAYRNLPEVMDRMEKLKPILKRRVEEWDAAYAAQQEKTAKSLAMDGLGRSSGYTGVAELKPRHGGPSRIRTVAPQDHGDIPVKVFRREQRRREEASRSGRSNRGFSDFDRNLEEFDMQRQMMEDTRRRMDNPRDDSSSRPRKLTKSRSPVRQVNSSRQELSYRYPTIKPSREASYTYDDRPRSRDARYTGDLAPQRPAKLPMQYDMSMPPMLPSKVAKEPSREPTPDTEADDMDGYVFAPSATLENGRSLRCLFLPQRLRETFLQYAYQNTANNLETCGILCGTIVKNGIFINHLVIPDQESTSDTCDMINEGSLFEYVDSKELMVFGWIHTHPTQTCFLSSRDLHTHAGFQAMMPESVAVVCAPRSEPSWGIFRLTDPPGLQHVLSCTQTGLFHPHPETNTYTDALRPGHVYMQELPFEVKDLRPDAAKFLN